MTPRNHVYTSRGVGRHLLLVCLAIAVLSGACGGSSSDGSSSPPTSTPPTDTPSTEPVTVNGTERVGWTQTATSVSALRAFAFFAYVDGARSPLADARCGSNAGPNGFDCSAALPKMNGGRHVIELATAGSSGLESARSSQLIVTMVGSGTAAAAEADQPASTETVATVAIPSCGDGAWQCTPIASPAGLGPITALEPLPDGRMLVIESGTRILVQHGDTWNVGYETVSDPRMPTHIAAVARDVAFDSTHFVYLAEVSAAIDGTRTARVVRTREVDSRLGEPATVVAGEALAHQGDPVLSIGGDGLIYLALPGDATAADPAARPGRLLRFAADGAAAGTASAGSATLSDIAAGPTSLAWDPQGHLWIAAAGEPAGSMVTRVDAVAGSRWTRQAIALSPAPTEPNAGVLSLVFGTVAASTGATPAYLVADSPATLYRGVIGGARRDALSGLTSLPLGEWQPTAVALRPDGALVVAAHQDTGNGELRQLITLTLPRIVPIRN